MDVKMASNKRVFISLPKKHFPDLAKYYELDHGLFVTDLIPHINEGYLQAYFREWGTVTACKIRKNPDLKGNKATAYVRFATEDEADRADWAGPHNVGGGDVIVKRVVSPKEIVPTSRSKYPAGSSLQMQKHRLEQWSLSSHPSCRPLLMKSLFLDDSSDEEVSTVSGKSRPRRSLGMGYILEDAQWLDNEME